MHSVRGGVVSQPGVTIRRAEFMMLLAYASDLATGHSRDFALRSCVLAMQIAERIKSSYSMSYQSDRKLADGTLRPVRIFYRGSKTAAGETAIFIPGMVVPSGGWSLLFLGLLGALVALMILPAKLRRSAA